MIKLRSKKKETQKSIAQISIKNNDGIGRDILIMRPMF